MTRHVPEIILHLLDARDSDMPELAGHEVTMGSGIDLLRYGTLKDEG